MKNYTARFIMYGPNDEGRIVCLGKDIIETGNRQKMLQSRYKWERTIMAKIAAAGETYDVVEREETEDKITCTITPESMYMFSFEAKVEE